MQRINFIQVPDTCITKSALLCIYNELRALNSAMYIYRTGEIQNVQFFRTWVQKIINMGILQIAESSKNYRRYRVTY